MARDGYVFVWLSDTELSGLKPFDENKKEAESEEEEEEGESNKIVTKKSKAKKEDAREDGILFLSLLSKFGSNSLQEAA